MSFDPRRAESIANRIVAAGTLIVMLCAGLAYGWMAALAAFGGVLALFGLTLLARVPIGQVRPPE